MLLKKIDICEIRRKATLDRLLDRELSSAERELRLCMQNMSKHKKRREVLFYDASNVKDAEQAYMTKRRS